MVNTNDIRNQLIKIARCSTDERMEKLSDDVMEMCDAYDEAMSLEHIVDIGRNNLENSFQLIENLRKSL